MRKHLPAAAVLGSCVPGADERRVAQVMGAIADRVTDQFVNPYTFPSAHKRILEPYNYYEFGQVGQNTYCSLVHAACLANHATTAHMWPQICHQIDGRVLWLEYAAAVCCNVLQNTYEGCTTSEM